MKERELQQTQRQLRDTKQLVSEFQQSTQQKDKTITDLQQTMSSQERKIQQLEQQDTVSRGLPQQKSLTSPQRMMTAVQKDISKMTWREGKNAPQGMTRGAAVVHGNTAYFRPRNSKQVYSYQNILGKEQWSQLPDNSNMYCGLTVINGLLTSVGGRDNDYTNTLLCLTGEGMNKKWSEIFPPMPTPRSRVACITTEQSLVVAGGSGGGSLILDIVEVMNIITRQWTTISPLPQKQMELSAAVCRDTLYLAGSTYKPSKSDCLTVFTCCLPDLLKSSNSFGSKIEKLKRTFSQGQTVWKEISSLPVGRSTLASFNGQLLAIGGEDDSLNHTTNVYRYDSYTNSWNVISQMKNKRSLCLAVTLYEDYLIVVGGSNQGTNEIDSVEILE